MIKEITIFGCYKGFDITFWDIVILDIFAVDFIKKNTYGRNPVIVLYRAFREYDTIDHPPFNSVFRIFAYL